MNTFPRTSESHILRELLSVTEQSTNMVKYVKCRTYCSNEIIIMARDLLGEGTSLSPAPARAPAAGGRGRASLHSLSTDASSPA